MTIQSQTWRHEYVSTGGTEYPYTFRILDSSHLLVISDEVTQVLNSDYTVDGIGDPAGGTVTFATAPTAGVTVIVMRNVPLTQLTDFVENDLGLAETREDAHDKGCMIDQQIQEQVDRTLLFPAYSSSSGGVLPEPEVGKTLEWSVVSPPTLRNVTPAVTGISTPISTLNGGWGQDISATTGFPSLTAGTISFINVVDVAGYATGGDGTVGDPWTGWDTAITWNGNTRYELRPGYFLLTSTLSIDTNAVHLVGAGPRVSFLVFAPTTDDTALQFYETGGTGVSNASLSGLTITSDDSTYQKVALDLVDVRTFTLRDVVIKGSVVVGSTEYWSGGSGPGSYGLQLRGREAISIQNVNIAADNPVVLADNPASTIDADHYSFLDCEFIANARPVVSIADGVNLTHVTFSGRQAWVKGTYGLYWNDTTSAQASIHLRLQNIRWEQDESASGWFVYIAHNTSLQQFHMSDCYGGLVANGIYLRKCLAPVLESVWYINTSNLVAINANATVYPLTLKNCYWQAGTTATISGLDINLRFPSLYGGSTTIPYTGVYDLPSTLSREPHITSQGWWQGAPVTIAQDATANLCVHTFVGMAFVMDDEFGCAQFYLKGAYDTAYEISDVANVYSVTADTASNYNVYASGDYYVIQNKRTGEHKIRCFLIGASGTTWSL